MKQKSKVGGSLDATAASSPGAIIIKMLPLNSLRPCGWNPNMMSEEKKAQLIKEVGRLRRLPKPIVVRKRGKSYQIVDGEHSWKAARECGLKKVPCEIIEADDVEAMRQTLSRNRHGENDPVRLGRLFQRMKRQTDVSGRRLGELIDLSEGTIRNFLRYADAANVRNDYAREHPGPREKSADEEIAGLSVTQVRTYMKLPADKRNEWFDAGARLENADEYKPKSEPQSRNAEFTGEAVPAPEPGGDTEAEVDNGPRPENGVAAVDDTEEPATAPAGATADQAGSFDQHVLDALEDHWQRANQATRQKFLAGILAEPPILAFARRIIKQGS